MRRREIRVATVSHRPGHGVDSIESRARLMEEAARFIERAKRMGADLVCFPECYPQLATGDILHHAEADEGGTLEEARSIA